MEKFFFNVASIEVAWNCISNFPKNRDLLFIDKFKKNYFTIIKKNWGENMFGPR